MDWRMAILIVAGISVAASLGAFAAYWVDKRRAVRGRRRLRERTLHLWEAAGGWPGGLLARRALRHKSRDTRFRIVSWAIIALHGAAWAAGLWLALMPAG